MKGHAYPRAGEFIKPKRNSGRKCAACGKAQAGFLTVEVNWFRGDDLSIPYCGERPCKLAILSGAGWP